MPDLGSPTPSPNDAGPTGTSPPDEELDTPILSASIPPRGKRGNVVKPAKSNDLNEKIRVFKRNVAKLHKAHEKLVQRAEELEQRERELDFRERELADFTPPNMALPTDADGTLSVEQTDLESRDGELEDRAIELESRANELDTRSHELDDRETELESRASKLDERAIELDQRDAELTTREKEIEESKQAEPAALESESDSNADELDALREQLTQRSRELEQHELELQRQRESLQPELDKLDAEQKAFRQEQGQAKRALTLREKAVIEQEQAIAEQELELQAVREEFDRWQEELDLFSDRIAEREAGVNERAARIEQQVTDIDRRTADLLNFEVVLEQREHDIAIREQALNQFEATLDQRQSSMNDAKALMALRRQRVSWLHKQLKRVSKPLRRKRKRWVKRQTNTLSIGPDAIEEVEVLSPSQDGTDDLNPQVQPSTPPSVTTNALAEDEDDLAADPLTPQEKRIVVLGLIALACFSVIAVASYLIAGAITKPTWRASLALESADIRSVADLRDAELAQSLNYLADRGLRPSADVEAFRNLLANQMTITPTEHGKTLAFLDHDKQLATYVVIGMQKGLQAVRGNSILITSVAAVDPQPFDDPQWRITYVLIVIGTLVLLAGAAIIRTIARRRLN